MTRTALSCFSGAGGLDLGLEAAGYSHVGLIEKDKRARQTLLDNRPDWPLLDIHDVLAAGESLKPKDLGLEKGELTLLAGGPPCQPFSMAAQWEKPRPGIGDIRGQAISGMLDLAEQFLPEAILIENVPGFLRGTNSAADLVRERLNGINVKSGTSYKLHSWILNAADFGVAQNRRRVIAIAFRDLEIDHPIPEPAKPYAGAPLTAWDAIGGLPSPDGETASTGSYGDLLPSIPEGGNYLHLTDRGAGPELFGYRTRYWSFLLKLRKDAPAWTLPASPGPSTGPFHWDNRHLTAQECLALQGMPIEWSLAGGLRDKRRLVGNATPTPVAEAMGQYIGQLLECGAMPTAADLMPCKAISRATPPPPEVSPRDLPPRWRGKVGPRLAHQGSGRGPSSHPSRVALE